MHSFPYLTSPVYHEMSKAISTLAASIWPSFGSTSTFKFQPEILVHALFCHVHREKSKLPRITMTVPGIISTFNLVSKQVSHPIVSSILFSLNSWMIEKTRLKILLISKNAIQSQFFAHYSGPKQKESMNIKRNTYTMLENHLKSLIQNGE